MHTSLRPRFLFHFWTFYISEFYERVYTRANVRMPGYAPGLELKITTEKPALGLQ